MLRSRFALRFHTSILLLWMFSAGLLTSKTLFALGLHSLFWRYTFAIVVAYGAFLLGVRIWLAYVRVRGSGAATRFQATNRSVDGAVDLPDVVPRGGPSGVFGGGGGTSGGGGASASFDGDVPPPSQLMAVEGTGLSASSGGGGGNSSMLSNIGGKVGNVAGDLGGGDEGCLIAFAVMIVVGLIALVIGGAFFVISMGPEILIDTAFNAMLAGGLIKAGGKVSDPDWFDSVLKATWIPFTIVLVMAWIFAATASVLTPQAHTFGGVWRAVWPLLVSSI
jgi:hypothetical protein